MSNDAQFLSVLPGIFCIIFLLLIIAPNIREVSIKKMEQDRKTAALENKISVDKRNIIDNLNSVQENR
jgi:hypothetical protein